MKLPCPKSEAIESYEILLAVCRAEDAYLAVGYKQMRDLLERICRAQMQNESLQMTDLSARISFVAAKVGLSVAEQNRLHTFRLTSNAILNRQQEPNREQLLRDAKTLAFFIRKLLEEDIPLELYRLLPRADATYLVAPPARERVQRMRVCFQYADEQYLYVTPIANLFLDEWIHAGEEEPDYIDCMKKAFRQYPIELAACAELRDPSKEKEFAKDCRMHFEHIRDVVQHTFLEPGYNLDKKEAVLEPSYICEALGIQGRLDYMQRDMSSFIEMKSGKADEFSMQGKVEPKENNKVQMLLYMAVLEYSMGQDRRRMHPYLLYTRYPLLYPARASWAQVRRVINLRNRIVAAEYGVQFHNHSDFTRNLLAQINPEVMNERKLSGRFWEQYLKPSISRFRERKAVGIGTFGAGLFLYAL